MPAPLPRSNGQQMVVIAGPLWDELCDRVEKLEGLKVANGSGLELLDQPGGKVLGGRPARKDWFWAHITAPNGTNFGHEWFEVVPVDPAPAVSSDAGDNFEALPGGRAGLNNLFEINGRTVGGGNIVQAWPGPPTGEASSETPWYYFDAGLQPVFEDVSTGNTYDIGSDDTTDETALTDGQVSTVDDATTNFMVLTRVAYDNAGDKTLYGFFRTIEIINGWITSISNESRQTVFTTGCDGVT